MRCIDLFEKTTVDNPAFRRWFGNSKVVDAAGQPMVMYHGTMFTFTGFVPGSHFGDIEAANKRLNFLSAPSETPRFRNHQGSIIPVYLSIQHPLRIVDDGGLSDGYELAWAVFKLGKITRQEVKAISDTGSPGVSKLRLIKLLAERGFDGFVYRNTIEGNADSWVPFRRNQVKSIFNNGAWSDADEISESQSSRL